MLVLGIETATDVCSVGLVNDGNDLADLALLRPRGHGSKLAGLIRAALDAAGATPADLNAVAVSSGPGSYTGLRIGASTAKGLCLATNAALVSVPTLAALAVAATEPGVPIVSALPSRRGEVYAAAFAPDGDVLRAPAALALADLDGWLPEADDLVVTGSAAETVREAVTRSIRIASSRPSGLVIARLGREMAAAGDAVDVAAFEPAYLKPFVSGGA